MTEHIQVIELLKLNDNNMNSVLEFMQAEEKALVFPEGLHVILKFFFWETNVKLKLPLFNTACNGKLDMATL